MLGTSVLTGIGRMEKVWKSQIGIWEKIHQTVNYSKKCINPDSGQNTQIII